MSFPIAFPSNVPTACEISGNRRLHGCQNNGPGPTVPPFSWQLTHAELKTLRKTRQI